MKYTVSTTSILKIKGRGAVIVVSGRKGWRELTTHPVLGEPIKRRHRLRGGGDEFADEVPLEGGSRWLYVIRIKDRPSTFDLWKAGASIVKALPKGIRKVDVGIVGAGWNELREVALGMGLAEYAPAHLGYKEKDEHIEREVVLHLGSRSPRLHEEALKGAADLAILLESITEGRRLVDTPPNDLSPETFAHRARDLMTGGNVEVEIHDEQWLMQKGFGLHLAVGQGSVRPPRLLHLKWGSGKRSIAIVGKGITFDSGGLSIKHPNKYMEDMKLDMAGGAAVIGLFKYLDSMEPSDKITVHGLVPMADNMPDGASVKPGDVVTGYGGKSVEILNTDAEGRLVLADSISYSIKDLGVDQVLTVATLTGACMVALGEYTAGWFASTEKLARRIEGAIAASGESYWRLPLLEELRPSLKSTIADIKNVGGSYGGAITAALFLRFFAEDTPFAHMDIAGPAFLHSSHGPYRPGATGFGIRTLIELVKSSL